MVGVTSFLVWITNVSHWGLWYGRHLVLRGGMWGVETQATYNHITSDINPSNHRKKPTTLHILPPPPPNPQPHRPFITMPPLSPPQRTLLTLYGLTLSDLPPPSAPASVLTPFLTTLLAEAIPLVDSVPSPNTTTAPNDNPPTNSSYKWATLPPKSYPPTSTAPVHLSSLTTTAGSGQREKETWIVRLSLHTDATHPGTASFLEFQTYVKAQHVDTEARCTPSVEGVWRGGRWTGCDAVVCVPPHPPSPTDLSVMGMMLTN